MNAIDRAIDVVRRYQDEPPGSPRVNPQLRIMIAQAIHEAVLEEREACAKLCDAEAKKRWDDYPHGGSCCNCGDAASFAAQEIRDRGKS